MRALLSSRRVRLVASVAGLVLFALTLHVVDAGPVVERLRNLGAGFLWLVLLAGVRLAARAAAWTVCAGGPSRLPFTATFTACIVGEGVGNVTPLGPAASEPAKVLWVRSHVGTVGAAASLAAETLIYSLATAFMLTAGSVALALTIAPAERVPTLLVGLTGATALGAGVAVAWRRRPLARAVHWVESKAEHRPRLRAIGEGVRQTADTLRGLLSNDPARLAIVALLQVVFQVAAVGEVWLTLVLLGAPNPTFLHALLLEYANRAVTVAFKFVPMRLGVDELASGLTASFLGGGASLGVAVAVTRKARVACWSIVGAVLFATRVVFARRLRPAADRSIPRHVDGATW